MEISRQTMLAYLANPNQFNCTLKLQYSTIASRSYGTEKRFFVPAPIISLIGDGWENKHKRLYQYYKNQSKQRQIDPSLLPQPVIEGTIGIYDVENHPVLDFTFFGETNTFIAKTIYIRHTENRQYVRLALELKYNSGHRLGSMLTDRIKVISKASKAKAYSKASEFRYSGIVSGQEICLSNRPKIPPVTRFITSEVDKFSFSTYLWNPLVIHLVDTENSPVDELQFCTKEGPIHYGDIIRLVDKTTGMSLPRMRICKVIQTNKIVVPDDEDKDQESEVLNQMQKVVFQMVDDEGFTYLNLDTNGVSLKEKENVIKGEEVKIEDTAFFLVYAITETEYTFYEANELTMQEVYPAPICTGISLSSFDSNSFGSESSTVIFLTGNNFTEGLTVWFGTLKCETTLRSTEMIQFVVPHTQLLTGDAELLQICGIKENNVNVPILLIREDGVIFPTKLSFTYQNFQSMKIKEETL